MWNSEIIFHLRNCPSAGMDRSFDQEINVRVKYNANIIGIKAENGMELMPNAEYVFRREEHLMIIGHKRDMEKILKKL